MCYFAAYLSIFESATSTNPAGFKLLNAIEIRKKLFSMMKEYICNRGFMKMKSKNETKS